jgi:two-component system response regulator NreC
MCARRFLCQQASLSSLHCGREREILQLLAEGKTNKEVAAMLNLSVYTVETHRTHILQKLNLHSVPELILYAVRKGIIA